MSSQFQPIQTSTTQPQNIQPQNQNQPRKRTLSTGAIVGIIIAVVVFVILMIFLGIYLTRTKHSSTRDIYAYGPYQ